MRRVVIIDQARAWHTGAIFGLVPECDLAIHEEYSAPAQTDPIPTILAFEPTNATRDLPRFEFFLAETSGPVRRQDTVGRPGHRVFVNPDSRRKESRYKINAIPWRGRDNPMFSPFGQRREIRLQRGNGRLVGQHNHDYVPSDVAFQNILAECSRKSFRQVHRHRSVGGKIEHVGLAIKIHREGTTGRLKPDWPLRMI